MLIGNWGPIVFLVSHPRTLSFSEQSKTAGGRWANHETINTKPITEFLGSNLRTIDLKLIFSSWLGTIPDAEFELMAMAAEKGQHYPLILLSNVINIKDYYIESLSATSSNFNALGASVWLEASITFKEYN
jgi:phage protein U